MKLVFFAKVPKNSDFSRHFQFYCNIVQNASRICLEKVIRLCNEWIRQTIHFNNRRMLILTFFKDSFQQNFKVQKSILMKYVIVIPDIIGL